MIDIHVPDYLLYVLVVRVVIVFFEVVWQLLDCEETIFVLVYLQEYFSKETYLFLGQLGCDVVEYKHFKLCIKYYTFENLE